MRKLDGEPGVVRLLEYYQRQDSFIIVMERPENCKDLFDFITGTVDKNIIGAPKMRNNYGAIHLLFFPIYLLFLAL